MELTNRILNDHDYRAYMSDIGKAEADRKFCRHGMDHCMDVARIACLINSERGYGLDRDLIYATALLHDIGRAEEYGGGACHDIAGAGIAEVVLVKCKATRDVTEKIIAAIRDHRGQDIGRLCGTEDDKTLLCGLIKEADKLSRACFNCKAYDECKWPEEKKNNIIIY